MTTPFRKVVIIGVGLIGGSLAMALKEKGLAERVVGVGRGADNLKVALSRGMIDEYTHEVKEAIKGADLVLLATPVGTMGSVVQELAPSLERGAIITDVGSVKGAIIDDIEPLMPEGTFFVATHPIAGTENSGAEAAFTSLFRDKVCIITPTAGTDEGALERVKEMWEATGSHVVTMDAGQHDVILAAISHLPHVAVYALVNAVAGASGDGISILNYAAGGFTDFTRIASSSPEMWRDICLMNREALIKVIDTFQENVERMKNFIEREDGAALVEEFRKATKFRESLKEGSGRG
ncbi:MAG: prephenate dehydrogenase [Thermodesulfobacteriota bacterium]